MMSIKPTDLDVILAKNFLFAKRSHANLNPKYSLDQVLNNHYTSKDSYNKYNLYCSFSNVRKLGINPKTKWYKMAPVIGIWSYPLEYLKSQLVDKIDISDIVDNDDLVGFNDYIFGSNMKYMFILKDNNKGRHLHSVTYTSTELNKDVRTIEEYYADDIYELSTREKRDLEYDITYAYDYGKDNVDILIKVLEAYNNISQASRTNALMNILDINAISWIDNGLHTDIQYETVWLTNRAFIIVDVIEDYNKKKFKKYFLTDRDDPSYNSKDWEGFIQAINEDPEEYYDIKNKKELLDRFMRYRNNNYY